MRKWFLLLLLVASFYQCSQTQGEQTNKIEFRDIYDENADAHADIATAIMTAQKNNKRVLLMFGADWCPWCQLLHHTLESDPIVNKKLLDHYELVLIDLGKRDHNMNIDAEYGQPNQLGLPALVVLDQDGSMLVKQETGSFEYAKTDNKKGHDPKKLVAFLDKWKATL